MMLQHHIRLYPHLRCTLKQAAAEQQARKNGNEYRPLEQGSPLATFQKWDDSYSDLSALSDTA